MLYCAAWFLFCGSAGVLVYAYLLYPIVLWISARLFGKEPLRDRTTLPSLAVVVPVFNEEEVIGTKIENLLACDYPTDKLTIWIGSDCSTDQTHAIVAEFRKRHSNIKLFVAPRRGGKTEVINQVVPQITADAIVFTDANTLHDGESLAALAADFSDPAVGCVAGTILHVAEDAAFSGEKVYRGFESYLKYLEGRLGATISAYGGFYAVRRRLWEPIPANAYSNDDVMIPMNVLRKGKRVIFEPRACSREEISSGFRSEFSRRIRIGAGNFQAFFWLPDFLNPLKGWSFFTYLSHKVTRWFSPFFLLGLLGGSFLFWYTLAATPLAVLFPLLSGTIAGSLLLFLVPVNLLRQVPYYFLMNIALLLGFFRFLRGIKSAAWDRTSRSSPS